jgi:hypothetical protein
MNFAPYDVPRAMVWDSSNWKDILRTEYQPAVPDRTKKVRMQLIEEAIGWPGGTQAEPIKIQLAPCSDGSLVYFEKPGKEAVSDKNGRTKNPNDMRPVVEVDGTRPKNATFTDVWSDLTEIAYVDMEAFRATLLLIYRSAFLLDHKPDANGRLRYAPGPEIRRCITTLDSCVSGAVSFRSIDKLLRFIDVLGWNEDVKYIDSNKKGVERTGRINTLLTCIKIPHDTVLILKEHDERIRKSALSVQAIIQANEGVASYVPLYNIMQTFLRTRGICTPSTNELMFMLSPYIVPQTKGGQLSGTFSLSAVQRTID